MSNGYNAKNYFAHGGSELVIGGKLTFLPGARWKALTRCLPRSRTRKPRRSRTRRKAKRRLLPRSARTSTNC